MKSTLGVCSVLLALYAAAAAAAPNPGYRVLASHVLGGEGGYWDYVSVDTMGHRIFIARGDRIQVVNQDTGAAIGEIPGLNRAHGVAFAYAQGHGFATSGGDGKVVMFDLKSLKVLQRTDAADDADALLYDPASGHVFTFNGDAHSASVIDTETGKRITNIDLGSKPESGATDGAGKIYVNLEEAGEIVELDAAAMKVTRKWSLAPCESPTGMAIDVAHQRLFSGCRNRLMAISDAAAGKLLTTLPIGAGVDGNAFDPSTGFAFSSNGDGTLSVVGEESPGHFAVLQTVSTMTGARTLGFDPRTHRLYTVSAKFGPAPAESAGGRRARPPVLPGTFTLLVVGR